MDNKLFNSTRRHVLRATAASGLAYIGLGTATVSANLGSTPDPDTYENLLDNMDGDGATDNPYIITDAKELQAIQADLSAHFELGNHINATGTCQWNSESGFDPIGTSDASFRGVFDGNGYEIAGLYIDRDEDNVGLFGYTTDATIKNIGVVELDISGDTWVGGLIGHVTPGIEINRTYTTGEVRGSNFVGGLIGVDGSGGDDGESDTIENSYAACTVSATQNNGGLVGGWEQADDGKISNLYWDSSLISTSGFGSGPDVTGLESEEMEGSAAVQNMTGLEFDTVWEPQTGPDGYPRLQKTDDSYQNPAPDPADYPAILDGMDGDGSANSPYEVTTIEELQAIQADLGSHLELTTDIDASGTADWNAERGFDPIGLENSPFSGSVDGNGYTVDGLTIKRPTRRYVGLFGYVEDETEISNIHLLYASVSGNRYTGALLGGGDLTLPYDDDGNFDVDLTEGGYISNASVVSSKIIGEAYMGGLAGGTGKIESCFVDVEIESTGDEGRSRVGALAGEPNGRVTNCYAHGQVVGRRGTAGIAGTAEYAIFENVYSTAEITGPDDDGYGGLFGVRANNDISSAYWDVDESAIEIDDADSSVGLSTAEMVGTAAADNMSGFDFDTTWELVEEDDDDATGDGYPILRSLNRESQLDVQGLAAGTDPEPATFIVQITDPADGTEVTEDESLTVSVEVTNTGGESGIQTISLESPVQQTNDDLEVAGDDTEQISFTIPGSSVQGEFDITVTSDDDSDSVTVTAVDPCFIATAAYDTPRADEIDILRTFRDDILQQHAIGRLFTNTYYRTSPPLARWIRASPRRRHLVREYFVAPIVDLVKRVK